MICKKYCVNCEIYIGTLFCLINVLNQQMVYPLYMILTYKILL